MPCHGTPHLSSRGGTDDIGLIGVRFATKCHTEQQAAQEHPLKQQPNKACQDCNSVIYSCAIVRSCYLYAASTTHRRCIGKRVCGNIL
ncbi:hypothetical protein PF005_g15987 [Phytophthora fragariae]|uniref:Uncharacterized protein n=1 Tax=Phytophthora fragariae TaxID=53985 RepID=A0A6A3X9N1_9STRA|nr:hypothetical protein PF009_g24110 [Phytophthora fragariae]KAE9075411.1 hypothetical protein PF010_g24313 [Phytophthora fragariae]KAE9076428.1 hypothetical protein PF007_g24629 [Phytophthora fragariae]KAE9094191.1 hypothetical protein PF006_g24276 [Phytophthora fragariae]KAE9184158.1 hypothetical protein PF004_g23742 [Phytophthora fragariae]